MHNRKQEPRTKMWGKTYLSICHLGQELEDSKQRDCKKAIPHSVVHRFYQIHPSTAALHIPFDLPTASSTSTSPAINLYTPHFTLHPLLFTIHAPRSLLHPAPLYRIQLEACGKQGDAARKPPTSRRKF